MNAVMTGPGDLRDQHWLDDQIEAIETGVEAVVNIARNWTDGRHLSRLHPGVSAAEYVTARVGTLGKAVVPVLLAESNWSNRQIATVAGVSHQTVGRASTGPSGPVERPAETLGADGKARDYAPRVVTAVVIDTPTPQRERAQSRSASVVIDDEPTTPFRVTLQAFERDIRGIRDGYARWASDERFASRFGSVMVAITEALEEETR